MWSGVIHTFVCTNLVQNGMLAAIGEARADSGEVHRRTDKRFAHAGAVGVVVAGGAILAGVTNRRIGLATVGEAGSQDIAGTYALTFHSLLFINDLEAVALADVEREIDVISEDIGQIHRQVVAEAGALGCEEQAAIDLAAGVDGTDLRLHLLFLEYVSLGGLFQREGFETVELASQARQLTLFGQLEFERLTDLQAGKLLGIRTARQDCMHDGWRQANLGKYGR